MDFKKYNKELLSTKVDLPSEKLKNELLHKLEITEDSAGFFKSEAEKNILLELEDRPNLFELEKYEKELNDWKFWN